MGIRWSVQWAHLVTDACDPPPGSSGQPQVDAFRADISDPTSLLEGDVVLPALPQVVVELQRVLGDPESSADDVAGVIRCDAGLSAFLLRLVNSAFYSFPSQIETISRAVALVGMRQLGSLALGASILDMFKAAKTPGMNVETFWKHGLAVGGIAQGLARRVGLPEPEHHFVCGLLHDVGRVLLHAECPALEDKALTLARTRCVPLYEAEARVAGFDHARLGGMLLRKWNFPFSLTMGVLCHHIPEKSERFVEPHVVHVADVMANALGICAAPGGFVPPLSDAAWRRAGIDVSDLQRVEAELGPTLEELFGMLL